MSFFQMGFPPKKDAVGRKSVSSESTEMCTDGCDAVVESVGDEWAADFWPVQHPIAPPPGDKPVECPRSSLMNEWRVPRSSHRKAAEPLSKRRHSVSHEGDHYRRLLFPNKSHNFLKTTFNTSTSFRREYNVLSSLYCNARTHRVGARNETAEQQILLATS
ncbi:hypothetical protein C2S52_013990 [Perilla frutescens var. hirtella]|nr:hypothetical protein C2S51_016228 [Perilla frutescens var. frutescens]KAH6776429.1 hypothetical protein C2S52_013990 [Perilla frutescens var. hirtella]